MVTVPGRKAQQPPIDGDFAASDTKKSAEIDDRGPRVTLGIDDNIYYET